jgi:ABC-2 type transport system ATP-binding protein
VAEIQAQIMGEKFISVKYQAGYDMNLAKQFFEENPFVSSIEVIDQKIKFRFNGSDEEQMKLLRKMVEMDLPILSFAEDEKDLEDVFMAITEEVEKI